jgi:hypothetical protein
MLVDKYWWMLMIICVEFPGLHDRKCINHAGARNMGWAAAKKLKKFWSYSVLEETVGMK